MFDGYDVDEWLLLIMKVVGVIVALFIAAFVITIILHGWGIITIPRFDINENTLI